MCDFCRVFFELMLVGGLFYLLFYISGLPFWGAFAVSAFISFLYTELLLKFAIKSSYEAISENPEKLKSPLKKMMGILFGVSRFMLPADIKKTVDETPLFAPMITASGEQALPAFNGDEEGVAEQEIIDRVYELGDQSVYEVMRPRTEIAGVDISDSINEVHSKFVETGYSKLIVYDENVDNIKGVVFAYDLFKSPPNLKSILREIIFVPENKKSIETLNLFLNNRISIAVVVDEFGGTAGIVTMEDIIEELFGEIKDEYDVEENICRKLSPQSFLFSGKVEIDYVNETFDLNIPYGEYETIGGLIITHSGRIPHKGEIVKIGRFVFTIIRGTNIKIDLVKMITAADSAPN